MKPPTPAGELPCDGCGKLTSISKLLVGVHEDCWVGGRGYSLWFCSHKCHSTNFEKVFARLAGAASGDKLSGDTVPDGKTSVFERLMTLLRRRVF